MNITLDEIKSKAPSGATHYIEKRARVQYWKNIDNEWWVCVGYNWAWAMKSIYRDYALESIKPL